MHLDNNSLVISHQIVYLLLNFADSAVDAVEFWVVPALNHAIILGIPFLHIYNPIINCKNYTII